MASDMHKGVSVLIFLYGGANPALLFADFVGQ